MSLNLFLPLSPCFLFSLVVTVSLTLIIESANPTCCLLLLFHRPEFYHQLLSAEAGGSARLGIGVHLYRTTLAPFVLFWNVIIFRMLSSFLVLSTIHTHKPIYKAPQGDFTLILFRPCLIIFSTGLCVCVCDCVQVWQLNFFMTRIASMVLF